MKKKEKKIVRRSRKMQRVWEKVRAAMSSAKVNAYGRIKRVLGNPCETNTYDDVHLDEGHYCNPGLATGSRQLLPFAEKQVEAFTEVTDSNL
jgi:hypothetical protein